MNTTNTLINSEIVRALGAWVAADGKAGGAKTKAVDLLWAQGVRADDCVAPEKGADRTLFESIKAGIATGFPAEDRKLLALSTAVMKSKPEATKAKRRYLIQQIGSKVKDLKAALSRREKAEADELQTEEEKEAAAVEASKQASDSARLLKDVTAWINRLEKAEATELPVLECLQHLKALSAIATKHIPE